MEHNKNESNKSNAASTSPLRHRPISATYSAQELEAAMKNRHIDHWMMDYSTKQKNKVKQQYEEARRLPPCHPSAESDKKALRGWFSRIDGYGEDLKCSASSSSEKKSGSEATAAKSGDEKESNRRLKGTDSSLTNQGYFPRF